MPKARPLQFGANRRKQVFQRKLLQILLVEPFELGTVEDGIGSADTAEGEALDEIGGAKHFGIIAAGPTQQGEEIAESFGQKAFVAVGSHAGRAVALGEAGAVGP